MALRHTAHRYVARGPQPQATESAPIGAPSKQRLPVCLLFPVLRNHVGQTRRRKRNEPGCEQGSLR